VYIPSGDSVHFYTRNVPTVAVRIDEWCTIFEGVDDGEFAGCALKGVRKLLDRFKGTVGVEIRRKGKLPAQVVFFAYLAEAKSEALKRFAGQSTAEVLEVGKQELELCAGGAP
jgi:hypothetical protein